MTKVFIITVALVRAFIADSQLVKTREDFRTLFFSYFKQSYIVPANLFDFFMKCSAKFYDSKANGYKGILAEIADRVAIARKNGKNLLVSDFLKHIGQKTDLYDSSIRTAYEKKTGCGDWLVSRDATTFDEVRAEYTRKRRLIRWDYVFIPDDSHMNGKKSVNSNLTEEQQKVAQERSNPKKSGYQYPVNIHIETSYKTLFQYMDLYPAGIKTFFKESTRTEENGYTTHIWQLQTIKNSKKKIAFFEHFNIWLETGLTIEEYKAQQEAEKE